MLSTSVLSSQKPFSESHVQKFDSEGNFIKSWGETGTETVQFVSAVISDSDSAVEFGQPVILAQNLTVEVVAEGLKFPTSMAFLGSNDILILEKNEGTVKRILNGVILHEPVLDVNVANESERGMLGIAVDSTEYCHNYIPSPIKDFKMKANERSSSSFCTYVFLYYTENDTKDDSSDIEKSILANRLYRYKFDNLRGKLVEPQLLLDLPAKERKFHNGGDLEIGPDNNLYIAAGSVAGDQINYDSPRNDDSEILNVKGGPEADGRGGILSVTQDGKAPGDKGILGDQYPLNLYYAYGIRNSFGIDFDPVTGNLWDTENGPRTNDEINLIEPGFNSGWKLITGVYSSEIHDVDIEDDLVDFNGKGKYSDPEFVWEDTVAPTEIKFFNSSKYGKEYRDDIFVGDYNNGYLYHFDLNEERTGLNVDDLEVQTPEELRELGIVFGHGFKGQGQEINGINDQGYGGITDIEVGPDGYLYVVSIGHGSIYRIVPSSINDGSSLDLGNVQKFDSEGNFIKSWGETGTETGQFLHLHGIAVDSYGNAYTTDEERQLIQKFDSEGNFIASWGTDGKGPGEFSSKIEDIAVDDEDNLYVVDYGNNRIQKFDINGTFITSWGEKGSEAGQFDRPWGLDFDSQGNVYVTDRENRRVQEFDKDGRYIKSWGKNGTGPGRFIWPLGVAVDSSDNIYIVDEKNSNVQKFDSNGTFLLIWGSEGTGQGQFKRPHGIDIGSFMGNDIVYVIDTGNQRIQIFTNEGNYITEFGSKGIGPGQFLFPHDVAVDQTGIFVSDQKLQHPELDVIQTFIREKLTQNFSSVNNTTTRSNLGPGL